MFGWKEMNCIVCGELSEAVLLSDGFHRIYICPTCGTYIYYDGMNVFSWLDSSEQKEYINFPSYLYYHHIDRETHVKKERNYIGDEKALKFHLETEQSSNKNIRYNLITDNIVKEFIPKTLHQKEQMLLRDIYNKRDKVSDITEYTINEIESAAFVIRQQNFAGNYHQYSNVLLDLKDEKFIEIINDGLSQHFVKVRITTKGIKYVEEGDKQMTNSNSGNITNYGNMVLNSNVQGSIIGDGNSSTNFDYQTLKSIIDEIEKLYKNEESFSAEEINQMALDIDEIKIAIQQQNLPVIQKCLNSIKGFVTNVGAGIIASGIWTKIQPFLQQLPGM